MPLHSSPLLRFNMPVSAMLNVPAPSTVTFKSFSIIVLSVEFPVTIRLPLPDIGPFRVEVPPSVIVPSSTTVFSVVVPDVVILPVDLLSILSNIVVPFVVIVPILVNFEIVSFALLKFIVPEFVTSPNVDMFSMFELTLASVVIVPY